jgi:predicted nucleic acid-binding protein
VLRSYVGDAHLLSSELVLAEVPRALRRAAATDRQLRTRALIEVARRLLETLAYVPVDRALVAAAGALDEPMLRTFDAIHVVSAAHATPADPFVTYDERQAAAARLAGLRTVAPA